MIKNLTITFLITISGIVVQAQLDTCGSLNRPKPNKPSIVQFYNIICSNKLSSLEPLSVSPQKGNITYKWFNNSSKEITSKDGKTSGNYNETFTPDTLNLKPSTTIRYYVKAFDINGCWSDSSFGFYSISRDMNQVPTLITDLSPMTIGNSKTYEILNAQGDMINWYIDNVIQSSDSTKLYYEPLVNGLHNFKFTQKIGLRDPAMSGYVTCFGPNLEFSQQVGPVGIQINQSTSEKVYFSPNPASQIVNFTTNFDIDNGSIKVFNIFGSLVYEKVFDSFLLNNVIRVNSLPNGIYTAIIYTKSERHSELIIVNH
jgi:hypothetical protein